MTGTPSRRAASISGSAAAVDRCRMCTRVRVARAIWSTLAMAVVSATGGRVRRKLA